MRSGPGARRARRGRRSGLVGGGRRLHAVWLAPLTVVAVRMALDPVRYPWYWRAVQTLVLLGAAELLAGRLRFARKRHRRKLATAR